MTLADAINSNQAALQTASRLILDKIKEVNTSNSVEADRVDFSSNFMKDWGFDSLDMIELGISLERQFKIDIDHASELGSSQQNVTVGYLMIAVKNRKIN